MNGTSISRRIATSYETEVRNRMVYVVNYIQDVRAGKWAPVVVPLWNLWAVEDLAREAGHEHIIQVCHQVEKRLRTVLPPNSDRDSDRDLGVLVRAAQYVLDHAASIHRGESAPELPAAVAEELGLAAVLKAKDSAVSDGPIYDAQGVVATFREGKVHVQLPRLDSVRHQWAVVSALRRIQKKVSSNLNWQIDASAIEDLPAPVMNALVALGRDLWFQERELVVTGLETNCLEAFPLHEPSKLCASGEVMSGQLAGIGCGLAICEV